MAITPILIHKIDDLTLVQLFDDIRDVFPEASPSCSYSVANGLNVELETISDEFLTGGYAFETANLNIVVAPSATLTVNFVRTALVAGNPSPSTKYDTVNLQFGNDMSNWIKHADKVSRIKNIVSKLGLPSSYPEASDDGDILRELMIGLSASHRKMQDELAQSVREHETRRAENEVQLEQLKTQQQTEHSEAMQDIEAQKAALDQQSYRAQRRQILREATGEDNTQIRRSIIPKNAILARWGVFFSAILLSGFAGFSSYTSISQLGVSNSNLDMLVEQSPSLNELAANNAQGPAMGYYSGVPLNNTQGSTPTSSQGSSPTSSQGSSLSSSQGSSLSSPQGSSMGFYPFASKTEVMSAIEDAQKTTNWFLIIRAVLSSLVAIGSLAYATSWLRSFYEAEVIHARQIDRFNFDLVRASWIMETVLDLNENNAEVPEEWMEGVTQGLFEGSNNRETLSEGTRALGALMGIAGSASVGADGAKFDFGKKGTKKLAEAARED